MFNDPSDLADFKHMRNVATNLMNLERRKVYSDLISQEGTQRRVSMVLVREGAW